MITVASTLPPEVLVVEDDIAQLTLFMNALTNAGISSSGCLTAPAAISSLQAGNSYRLLVTDINLRGQMSGFELAELVRRWRPNMAVLFITGYSKEVAYRHQFADQNAEMLLKPFKLGRFADKVATLLFQQNL